MKTFEIQVKHDNGETVLRVRARNIDAANEMVMQAEGCPRSALGWWRVVPTAAQIKKTKNLLRNL